MRLETLRVIRATADELGAPPPPATPSAAAKAAKEAVLAASKAAQQVDGAAGAAGGGGKTRRWGTSSLRPAQTTRASALGEVAPLFFYPLLSRYDDPANTFKLLGEDCFLLENLLHALAALLRGAAAYPCAQRMARAALEFAWSLRLHGEAAVRRGALVALCAVAQVVTPATLLDQYGEMVMQLQDWLGERAVADADQGVRELAEVCQVVCSKGLYLVH